MKHFNHARVMLSWEKVRIPTSEDNINLYGRLINTQGNGRFYWPGYKNQSKGGFVTIFFEDKKDALYVRLKYCG